MKFRDYRASVERDPRYIKGYKALKTRFALGDAILRARMDHQWSQADLAKRVGTRQANISRVEAGTANPTLDLVNRLLDTLGISILFTKASETAQAVCDYEGNPVEWPSAAITSTANVSGDSDFVPVIETEENNATRN
jgi:transcriptional regulator with XRE-family HTH domain